VLGISLPVGAVTTFLTQPIEFVKTRVQVRTEAVGLRSYGVHMGINPFRVFREVHATGVGMRGFYYGFESALYSRLGYLFVRNSLHKIVYDAVKPKKPFNDLTTREKGVMTGFIGAIAAFATSPFEMVMTR
jgi:solute carrier family 25 oxoglutarate transporter 11